MDKLTYKEFIKHLQDNKILSEDLGKRYSKDEYTFAYGNYDDILGTMGVRWLIGGVEGGGWQSGSSKCRAITDIEKEPDFESLDQIFEMFLPNITFLKYKKFCSQYIINDEHEEDEYYGNCSRYAIKKINLVDLHKYIAEELEWNK